VKGEEVKESQGVMHVNKKPEEVLQIIANVNKYTKWIDKIEYSKLLTKSPTVFLAYMQVKMPIGVTDRDLVLKNVIKKLKNGGYKVEITSAYNQYPEQEDFIRIKKAYGFWLIKPDKGRTKVVYQFFSDPAGSLPSWVVNMFLVDTPYNTLDNLRNMLK